MRTIFEEQIDQFGLYLLLSELKKRKFETQRLKLQKLVYLIDIFGTIFRRKPTNYTFIVYNLGPFSKEVTSDMDRLVSSGIVDAEEIKLWDPEHERSFDYSIKELKNEKANAVVNRLQLSQLKRAIDFTVRAAGNLNSEDIRRLVYTEPNYLEAKKIGYKTVINPEYSLAVNFRESVRRISAEEYSLKLSEEQIGLLYLDYMKSHLSPVR